MGRRAAALAIILGACGGSCAGEGVAPEPDARDCSTASGVCAYASDLDCALDPAGDLCASPERCVGGQCQVVPDTVPRCDTTGDSPCLRTACDGATGLCRKRVQRAGTACNDGDLRESFRERVEAAGLVTPDGWMPEAPSSPDEARAILDEARERGARVVLFTRLEGIFAQQRMSISNALGPVVMVLIGLLPGIILAPIPDSYEYAGVQVRVFVVGTEPAVVLATVSERAVYEGSPRQRGDEEEAWTGHDDSWVRASGGRYALRWTPVNDPVVAGHARHR